MFLVIFQIIQEGLCEVIRTLPVLSEGSEASTDGNDDLHIQRIYR